ncbi:MAG: DUF5686 family protein [Bacteroidota bacterium]|nr:DUF5686 family protein [Bacteroidota bacterium]
MRIRIAILFIFLCFTPLLVFSQADKQEVLKGIVYDAQTNEPIPSASISLLNQEQGTRANKYGKFSLPLNSSALAKGQLKVSCVGYKTEILSLPNNNKELEIRLTPQTQDLKEVTVKKQKYINKNNPAVELIQQVIANKNRNKKEALDYYENEKYEKVQFAINNITPDLKKKKIFKHFQFVFDNIDSLKNNGKKILPIYQKEVISTYYYQRSPQKVKEIVKAQKAVSFAGLDNKGIEDNIKYLYQDINIYDNNISFLSNQFLSPIAGSAPVFYRYYILDTIQSGADKCVRMYFGSRNKVDMLFQGYLYIMLDGSYAVKKIELSVSKDINLNWINDVKIVQEFEKTPSNNWMLASDQISINFGLTKKSRGLFGQKIVSYTNYKFKPEKPENVFKGQSLQILDSAKRRSNDYWDLHRQLKLSNSEAGVYTAMDSVQKVPVFKRAMNIATVVLFGYEDLGKYEIGPVNTFYMYNPIEGVRLRFGGRTTDKFSKKINLEDYVAYGFTDNRFKYYLGASWSFTNRGLLEFPVKSLKVSYQNETQLPGQQMQFLMEDNFLLSIKRGVNDKLFYNKTLKVEHLNEFENHFSYTLGYKFTNEAPGGTLRFNYTDYLAQRNDVNSLNISEFYLNLRYAPNESFYQGKTFRIPYFSKYPIFELRYNVGSKLWKNDYNYQLLRFSIRKRFLLSVLGYSDVVWEAGKLFGKVPYPLLNMPQANQTYSYQIESYNMMNFLEFVTDQYTSLLIDHTFNGFFFNKIPLIKHLNWREIVTCKVLYGDVTKNNDPRNNSDLFRLPVEPDGTPTTYTLGKIPYIEGSIGIGNIFKFFRVDFVKRFTYLTNPHVSEYGLRMRFRFDF